MPRPGVTALLNEQIPARPEAFTRHATPDATGLSPATPCRRRVLPGWDTRTPGSEPPTPPSAPARLGTGN